MEGHREDGDGSVAGMSDTPTPNRRARRAEAATAPVKPAVAASADRAAIERAPGGDVQALAATDSAAVPAADLPDGDTAVLPEPTLIAEPDKPMPIVTASPPLAIEPGAVDVVQAEVAADRVAAGSEPVADRDGPNFAAAGQPVLTIEPGVDRHADRDIDRLYDRSLAAQGDDILAGGDWPADAPSHDALMTHLDRLALANPEVLEDIRLRFFAGQERPASFFAGEPFVPTVRVIKVVGPQQGRRRAGNSFGPQPRHFTDGELTEAEILALQADPLLSVSITDVPADQAATLFG